ncbi:MAG: flagellar FliJ family protein [Xanthomonadaceae bacterium]|nr:flagellar FliJ family protein [Xanthomonadaceae bacterium]
MKRFQFKLEALLTIRERQVQEAMRILAETQRNLMNEVDRKNSLKNDLERAAIRREKLSEKIVGVQEYRIEDLLIQGNRKRIEFAERAIIRAKKWVNQAMAQYLAARQRKSVIDKLKEKAKDQFKTEVRKYEQKQLDDLYVMRSSQRHWVLGEGGVE